MSQTEQIYLQPSLSLICQFEVPEAQTSLPEPVPLSGKEPASSSLSNPASISKAPVSYENGSALKTNEKAPTSAPAKLPTEEEMKGWSVKKLKTSLGEAGLHQYGLKADLVKRLREFYRKNPSKIPKPDESSISSVPTTTNTQEEIILPPPVTSAKVDETVKKGIVQAPDGSYYDVNGKRIEVLGRSTSSTAFSSPATSVNEEVDLVMNEKDEKIKKKLGEIKTLEKEGIEFYKSGMSILCRESFSLAPHERRIVTFKMPELDLFVSELNGRRILVKERDNSKRIITVPKQITNPIINERKSEVDVLVSNEKDKECVVAASDKEKLIRVYIEKKATDNEKHFDIPEDDDIVKEMDSLLEKETLEAATTIDIVLQPKSYHTETCTVAGIKQSWTDVEPFVMVERTKNSGMNIGMRKMILVPKSLHFMKVKNNEGELKITMYNASKQTLRISKKTIIATIKIQRQNMNSEKSFEVVKDTLGKGVIKGVEPTLMKDDRLVLLTYQGEETRSPSVVKTAVWDKTLYIPFKKAPQGTKVWSCTANFLNV